MLKYPLRLAMDYPVLDDQELNKFSRQLKAICEPNRLMLLEKIIEGVQCNADLCEALQMAPNLISHHLGVLREAGLVDVEHDPMDARWVNYSINIQAVEDLKKSFGDFFNPQRFQPRRSAPRPQNGME